MLRVLTLSTLFPDVTRPRFGPFVEQQTLGLAAHPDVELRVVAPVGIPVLGRFHPRYRALGTLPDSETWKGLTVHRPRFRPIPGVKGRFHATALARALRRPLARIREQFPFDVIDAEFFFPDGPAAVILGREFDVPVSIKARGSDIHVWTAANSPTRGQIVAAACGADGLLSVSAALKRDMVALGMPEQRISVHCTGIDRGIFNVRDRIAVKAALAIRSPLIVSVGALTVNKGHEFAIAALADIPDATLALIGSGPARRDLSGVAERYAVGNRVRFLGSMPHRGVADWFAAADVMVLMSAAEGLANAWIEALACGTPIVIPDVGGAREVLDRPEAGRLVPRDAGAVAAAVNAILANPPDRNAVSGAAARFSWERNSGQLYQHLAALRRR